MPQPVIAVIGEALIDLIVTGDGHFAARPGGGPYNTARTIGRLGLAPSFLGRLSRDGFGGLLRDALRADGVTVPVRDPVDAPTTLALAEMGDGGSARYRFYLTGTSSCELEYPVLAAALPAAATAVHAGSLALVAEPVATSIERLAATGLAPGTLLMVDPNYRPAAVTRPRAYRERLCRILRRADVVKVSTEDLSFLFPGAPAPEAAAALLGEGPALVVTTDGPRPARAYLPGREVSAEAPPVDVVDTIGAGDAFGGAFLAWWAGNGFTREDLHRPGPVAAALAAAAEVASLTCTRPGAEPPWRAELRAEFPGSPHAHPGHG